MRHPGATSMSSCAGIRCFSKSAICDIVTTGGCFRMTHAYPEWNHVLKMIKDFSGRKSVSLK